MLYGISLKVLLIDLIDILNSVYNEDLLVLLINLTSRTKKFSNDNKFVKKKAKYTRKTLLHVIFIIRTNSGCFDTNKHTLQTDVPKHIPKLINHGVNFEINHG